jgi:ABC-type antimicrobial peptide transport system permease subunit
VLNADGKADKYSDLYVLPDSLYNLKWTEGKGEYSYAVATMPTNKADIEKLVKYCYTEQGNMKYQIENSVTFELDTVNEVLKVMSKVFLYIGIGFAVFAMIMLSNFIATSISYKKQEIGIL